MTNEAYTTADVCEPCAKSGAVIKSQHHPVLPPQIGTPNFKAVGIIGSLYWKENSRLFVIISTGCYSKRTRTVLNLKTLTSYVPTIIFDHCVILNDFPSFPFVVNGLKVFLEMFEKLCIDLKVKVRTIILPTVCREMAKMSATIKLSSQECINIFQTVKRTGTGMLKCCPTRTSWKQTCQQIPYRSALSNPDNWHCYWSWWPGQVFNQTCITVLYQVHCNCMCLDVWRLWRKKCITCWPHETR